MRSCLGNVERNLKVAHIYDRSGAAGIVFPHVDTPEEAAVAVAKCRYAYSGGERSLSSSALIAGLTNIAPPGSSHERVADENIAVICQIESAVSVPDSLFGDLAVIDRDPQLSLTNLKAIAATPDVNALMLGQSDLRVSLGLPSKPAPQGDDRKFLAAVDHLIEVAKKHHKALMAIAFKASPKSNSWLFKFKLLLISADLYGIVEGHRQDLINMETALEDLKSEGASLQGYTLMEARGGPGRGRME